MGGIETDISRLQASRLKTLFQITQDIVGILDIRVLFETILKSASQAMGAERGLLAVVDEKSGDVSLGAVRNLESNDLEEARDISRSTIRQVLQGSPPVVVVDAQKETKLRDKRSVNAAGIRGLLCAPLKAGDRVLGALYLDNRSSDVQFNEEARMFLSSLANLAAIAIANAERYERSQRENRRLRQELHDRFQSLIGRSEGLRRVREQIETVAPSDVSVVIEGESGTGKELVARAIHALSLRAAGPFVAVSAAELPESLAESELFGHRRGAFTGADGDKRGILEEAEGGTVFLDEIVSLPAGLQAKLLRVLQEREVRRVGENLPRKIDVRLLCATNRPLQEMVREGKFRDDLYFRLNVVTIRIPPLRERKGDVVLLAEHFLKRYATKPRRFAPAAIEALNGHEWPGNVRELENVVRRALVFCAGEEIGAEHLGLTAKEARPPASVGTLREALESTERALVERALEEGGGNVTRAAEKLGVARQQLQRLIRRYGLGGTSAR